MGKRLLGTLAMSLRSPLDSSALLAALPWCFHQAFNDPTALSSKVFIALLGKQAPLKKTQPRGIGLEVS